MKTNFKIVPYSSKAWEKAVKLREKILRMPLGEKFTTKELEEEKNHIQIVGYINDEIIATAVLVPEDTDMKMQRVVVSDKFRNLNIGTEMMGFCESYILNEGYKAVYCHARDSAVNFYLKNGYLADGDYFPEDGIPHLKMKKVIAN